MAWWRPWRRWGRGWGPWPGRGPWSMLPPWERPGWRLWGGGPWGPRIWELSVEDERRLLEEYRDWLREQLEAVEERLRELERGRGRGREPPP